MKRTVSLKISPCRAASRVGRETVRRLAKALGMTGWTFCLPRDATRAIEAYPSRERSAPSPSDCGERRTAAQSPTEAGSAASVCAPRENTLDKPE